MVAGFDITLADGTQKKYEQIEAEYRAQLDDDTRERLFPHGVEDDVALECWDFIDSVLHQRRPEICAEDTLRAKAASLAIYESAALGGPVRIQDVIDGKVSAFGISAPLTRDMATLQYEKAFGSVKGLYQYFDNACARRLFNGYTYLNKESDMGIPGLTKAKKSYHPFKMVRSVKLILKN